MIDIIRTSKHNKFIALLLVFVMALSFGVVFSAQDAFAKTHGSDAVSRVFFYASDKNGSDVYIADAAIDELQAKAHGNTETGENYYATLIDQLPTVTYTEGKGLSFDEFIKYMAGKSSLSGSAQLAFNEEGAAGDKLIFYSNDGGSKSGTVKTLCSVERYYFPTLMDNFVAVDMAVNNREQVIADGVEMPAFLAVESYSARVSNLTAEIAANDGNLTGCLKNKLDTENALRLVQPMTVAELGDDENQAVATANSSFKWVYNIGLKYADNADSPITSQGVVAAPTCQMILDSNNTLRVTFNCATAGAEIYHSLNVEDGEVYNNSVPQYKYDGNAIEIENFDPQNVLTISYMAVKQGYSDAGLQKITSDNYQEDTNPDEPNFTYSLKADKTQVQVDDKINLQAALTADSAVDVYGLQYRVKIPAADFTVNDVQPAAGWQYSNTLVGGEQVLTFVNMQRDDTNPVAATKLTANQALNIATINIQPLNAGNLSITSAEMIVTKADGSKYSNIKGDNLTFSVKTTTSGGGGGGGSVTPVVDNPGAPDDPDNQTNNPVVSGKFNDVASDHWAAVYINKLADDGIINGKTVDTFAPNDAITRAEFTAILSRMSGEILPAAASVAFTDVANDAWYAQNVAWAVNTGITNGISETKFAPNAQISRQEMAVMIIRYVEYQDKALQKNAEALTFADNAQIAAYAKEAVSVMQQAGIISGKGNNMFAPLDNATRAEAAKMLGMLLEQVN